MKHLFKVERINKSVHWIKEEDILLLFLVSTHKRKWSLISKSFKEKTGYQCYLRYNSINPSIKKGAWEPFEDQKLIEGMRQFGKQWSRIASQFFSNRNAKQIRDRYTNYLDPVINKGKFSPEEDLQILDLYKRFGNKWSLIKQFVPGRSSDSIKNRFNSSIKRNKKLAMEINFLTCILVISYCLTVRKNLVVVKKCLTTTYSEKQQKLIRICNLSMKVYY
jgi:hypothetical protein